MGMVRPPNTKFPLLTPSAETVGGSVPGVSDGATGLVGGLDVEAPNQLGKLVPADVAAELRKFPAADDAEFSSPLNGLEELVDDVGA